MGNGCSSFFKVNKICSDDSTNIIMDIKDEKKDTKDTKDSIKYIDEYNNKGMYFNKHNHNKVIIRNENDINNININKSSSFSANVQKRYVFNKNELKCLNINSTNKQNEEAKNSYKENLKSENFVSFTNLVNELDLSFEPQKSSEQFEIFDRNYISVKKNYNEKMLEVINKIRKEPKSMIEDLEKILHKNNEQNKIYIENDETHENIVFNDITQDINETIDFLKKVKPISNKFNLNEELILDLKHCKNSELPLEKKVTKILIDKKKDMVKKFPKIQFFINFVKDAKIGLLYLLMKNDKKSNFRNIIFDNKYREFNVTWMRDKNNVFISFLCFS